jgi:acetoacetyl-CoA synthetase
MQEGSLLWAPSQETIEQANLTHYMRWLGQRGIQANNYPELWHWSVENTAVFWETLWDYFGLKYSQKWETALANKQMPGAQWFIGARLNYAENIFAKRSGNKPMLLYKAENKPIIAHSWADIYEQTRRLASVLRGLGVQAGDRVVAYLPNIPEAVVALLAVASLGAIWSSCPPDFGENSVLDRFSQIEPKVLIAVDGYEYNGKSHDRRPIVAKLQTALPTVEQTILITDVVDHTVGMQDTILWTKALANADSGPLAFAQVPFDHPLWVLYSSGTTGLPKPIVHGHGGILLEQVKATVFHNDMKPQDRFYWYSSTGWMMWNYVVGSLLAGATAVLYNGSPAYPDMNGQFALAEEAAITYFGTSAAFITACMNAGIRPNQQYDLSRIRGVGSTGSPLTAEGFQWIYDNINRHLALESLSGGTDLCTAFVGGVRIQPIYLGEIQGASLGAKVQAFNEAGEPVVGEVGELVITEPMPSMPLYFWNDDNMERYKESYFEMFPGVWRHGDWVQFNERGGCVIYGRSDATINRQGIRMGTSEIYRVIESFEEVLDSLIIDLEFRGRDSFMPLFVVLRPGLSLDDDLKQRISHKLRTDVSPRHVPNDIIRIDQVPYTLSGKKMEVPIRKILLGMDAHRAANIGAMRNPEAIDFFNQYARQLNKQ